MSSSDVAWLETLVRGGGPALVGTDLRGRAVFWSAGAQTLFGWPAQDVIGRVPPSVPEALLQEWQLQRERVLASGEPSPSAETQRVARDGRSIAVLRSSYPVRDEHGEVSGLLDVLVDITTLKQLDEESRALAQVRERELVAMDLHDGLVQSLYALVLTLAAHEQSLDPGGSPDQLDAVIAIRAARAEIQRVIEETHSYISNLRARGFAPRTLEPGLRLVADGLRLNARVEVQLRFDPVVDSFLPSEARGHLLYIVREAASNVIRHAVATRVRISLGRSGEAIVLKVVDNGRGFSLEEAQTSDHRGLRNLAERARLVGARLDVRSRPRCGTRVSLKLPL
jgi:PAS domain S-box-containing protein